MVAKSVTNIGTTEDTGDRGVPSLAVRKDSATDLSSGAGTYAPLQVDATGNLRTIATFSPSGTQDVNVIQVGGNAVTTTVPISGSITTVSTVTNLSQLAGAAVPIGAGLEATAVRVTLPTDGTGVVKLGAGVAAIGKLAANSGVDIGDVDILSSAISSGAASVTSGARASITPATAIQLIVASTPCKQVIVSADLGNTNPIVVGGTTAVATSGSMVGAVLVPGNDPVNFAIDNVNKLYFDVQTSGDRICFTYLN